ncbi:hypothetical protein [Melittangium boletus]|uniref:hypothetical protein n=1 Tax=Melittangium boletus TaxID=83453 RepID=UPI0012FE3F97|nr:hypothetical protein [Melittangium boletus]
MAILRLNPLGLENQTRFGYQSVLYRNDSALFRDNYLYLGASSKLNPAGIKIGPMVELQPLSVFTLRLLGEYVGFFSTFNAMQSFSSPNQEYSDALLAARGASGENYAASGLHFMIEPLLQMKVGPLLLRNRFSLEYWSMALRGTDRVWYDPTPDTLLPGRGFTLGNEADILFAGRPSLLLGARYNLLKPLYRARDFAAGEVESRNNGYQRLGLLAAYIFWEEPYTAFNRPTLLLNVAWYLQHRYRAGAEVSRSVPYVALAFSFQSDLLDGAARN